MQTRQRGRTGLSKDFYDLNASHIEILGEFDKLDCNSPLFTPKKAGSDNNSSLPKKKTQRYEQIALDGILGLASLMNDQDREEPGNVPADWFQPYPICNRISWDVLPTGLPLQTKDLIQASYDIYYQGR